MKQLHVWVIVLMGLLGIVEIGQCSVEDAATFELRALLQKIDNFQADFTQQLQNEKGRPLQKLKGKVKLKKPVYFHWEITVPESHLVISDGNKIWDYDKELAQITVQHFSKAISGSPMSFLLTNTEEIAERFFVKKLVSNGKHCLRHSDQCFVVEPKDQDNYFKKIRIGFKDSILQELEIFDQIEQLSVIQFSRIEKNDALTSKDFTFIPPKHVDIIHATE